MVVIRLSRVGKSAHPSYRIIVSDKRKDPWGDSLEVVGFYDPIPKPKVVEFKKERVAYWLSVGAQPSPTVHNLMVDAGVVAKKKRRASKNAKVEEGVKEAAPAPAVAAA